MCLTSSYGIMKFCPVVITRAVPYRDPRRPETRFISSRGLCDRKIDEFPSPSNKAPAITKLFSSWVLKIANVSSWKWHKQARDFIATLGTRLVIMWASLSRFDFASRKYLNVLEYLSGRKSSWATAPFSDADLPSKNISHRGRQSPRVCL